MSMSLQIVFSFDSLEKRNQKNDNGHNNEKQDHYIGMHRDWWYII